MSRAPKEVDPVNAPRADDSTTDDDALLDELFASALRAAERGETLDVESWLEGRERLRVAVIEAVELANDVALNTNPTLPLARRAVAGYEIVRELGRGSMGAVFLARQQALGGRHVALKVLPASAALSGNARRRFLAEARALARVSHPNVVKVHDVLETDDVCAYAMEWVDGASLADLLRSARDGHSLDDATRSHGINYEVLTSPTPTVGFCRVAVAIARALGEVHRAGLLHRDVKPSNILLRRDGTPLLSDFGLVRDIDSEHVTRTGHYLGTPAYSSPEQLRGEHDVVDARSDVYSLAATLYEALTRRVPYGGSSSAGILAQAEMGSLIPASKLDRASPRDLDTILSTALDPVASRRYATADDFAEDIERLLALRPILARPTSAVARIAKWSRRNRTALVGLIIGIVALVLGSRSLAAWGIDRATADERALAQLARAQEALLESFDDVAIFMAAFSAGDRTEGVRPVQVDKALRRYEDTLRIHPSAVLARRVKLERDVVALATSMAQGVAEPSSLVEHHCPLTTETARRWRDTSSEAFPSKATIQDASPEDRRHLGLLAFLIGGTRLALDAWQDASLSIPSDPLADAALGQLHLVLDEPQLAYPRLVNACNGFPGLGVLAVRLADAAAQVDQPAVAERLLKHAEGLPMPLTKLCRS